MGCSKEDMVYVDEPSDSAYCESIDIEWYGHYDNQTSVPAHVNYHTNDPLGYDVDRAHTDCTLSQPSAFNPGHNSTSRLLLVEQTGSGSAYTTQSLEGPVSQKVEPYRDVEGSHTALVAYTALVSDGGPELRFEEYNDNSQTWQPAKQYEGDCTGLCPSYASVDKPVENIEVDANHHLYASLHEEYSINDCHGYPSPYPAQIEFDSIGMGEQTPTQAMPNQMRNHARRPSLSTLIMERSFPEYMYTPDHKLAERLDTSLSEVHDNSQTSYYDVISPLTDTTTPVFFQNPHLGLGEVTSTVCQPAVAQTANISPASQTVPQYTVFPDFYVHTVSRNEIIVDFASNEYGSQSNALSRCVGLLIFIHTR